MEFDEELYNDAETNLNKSIYAIEDAKDNIQYAMEDAPTDWQEYLGVRRAYNQINNIYDELYSQKNRVEESKQAASGGFNFNSEIGNAAHISGGYDELYKTESDKLDKLVYERQQLEEELKSINTKNKRESIKNKLLLGPLLGLLNTKNTPIKKELIQKINEYNRLINEQKEIIFNMEMQKNYSDPNFQKLVAEGKELSKKFDALGRYSNTPSSEAKILSGAYGEQEIYDYYLSDEQKDMYYYILAKNNGLNSVTGVNKGYDAGLNYLKHLEQGIHNQWGTDLGNAYEESVKDNPVGKAVLTFGLSARAGFASFLDGVDVASTKFMNDYLGYDTDINTKVNFSTVAESDYRQSLGVIEGLLYDVNQGYFRMLPSIILSMPFSAAATAAAGIGGACEAVNVLKVAGDVASSASLFSSSYGSKYKETINQGYSDYQAGDNAFKSAVFETASEKLLGGIEELKIFKLPEFKGVSGAILNTVMDMAQEGVEEVIQDVGSNWIDNKSLGQNNDTSIFTKENAYTFLVSALTAGYMNSLTGIYNPNAEISESTSMNIEAANSVMNGKFKDVFNNINNNLDNFRQKGSQTLEKITNLKVYKALNNNYGFVNINNFTNYVKQMGNNILSKFNNNITDVKNNIQTIDTNLYEGTIEFDSPEDIVNYFGDPDMLIHHLYEKQIYSDKNLSFQEKREIINKDLSQGDFRLYSILGTKGNYSREKILKKLNLTRDQKTKINNLIENYENSIEGIWANRLTEEEKYSLLNFTRTSGFDLNSVIRTGYTTNGDLMNFDDMIENLNSVIEKQRGLIKNPIKVYRGVDLDAFDCSNFDELKTLVGTIYTDKAFMSTALTREAAYSKAVLMEIDVPVNTKGAYIEKFNGCDRKYKQAEYLLGQKTRLLIKDVIQDEYQIILKGEVLTD